MSSARAPVKPRFISSETGQSLPLEDVIYELLDQRKIGVVQIVGEPGTGKTTAIRHLEAVLPSSDHIQFADNARIADVRPFTHKALVVCGTSPDDARSFLQSRTVATLKLAPWDDDALIEYLLSVHPSKCRSVMSRLAAAADKKLLHGKPEMCSVILDQMAADETLTSVRQALRREIDMRLNTARLRRKGSAVALMCLRFFSLCDSKARKHMGDSWELLESNSSTFRFVGHRPVQISLAAEFFIRALRTDSKPEFLAHTLPEDLIRETADHVQADELSKLDRLANGRDRL